MSQQSSHPARMAEPFLEVLQVHSLYLKHPPSAARQRAEGSRDRPASGCVGALPDGRAEGRLAWPGHSSRVGRDFVS
jgi:hypothetical protein